SQNRSRPGATQRHGKTDDKEFSVHWHLIAVILGILCLLLLVTATVLGTKFLQCIREKHQQEEILRNLSQNCHNIQNAAYLKEQLLNKTLEYDILENETLQQKKKLDSLFIEKKRCDKYEQTFIQAQTHPDYYWIGLSYNEKESKWKWIDNDTSSGINLTIMSLPPGREECVFLTSTRIDNTDCSKTYNCI
ncbi:hypothetical protein HPG69_004146, partial [Diceros bicornis minor]